MLAAMDAPKTLLTFDIGGPFHAEGSAADSKLQQSRAADSQPATAGTGERLHTAPAQEGPAPDGPGASMGVAGEASGNMPLQLALGEIQRARDSGKAWPQGRDGAVSEGQIRGALCESNAHDTLSLRSPNKRSKVANGNADAAQAEGSPSSARNMRPERGGAGDSSAQERGGSPAGDAAGSHEKSSKGGSSRYESQKRRDWNTFGQYLRNHRPPVPMPECTAQHVVEFLRYLDQFGKTKVHEEGCRFFGSPGANPCSCPMRQAWGSLDSLIGRLRAAYEENGGAPDKNPFAQRIVRVYLREIREVQAKARGTDFEKRKRKRGGQGADKKGTAPGQSGASAAMASALGAAAPGLRSVASASLNALQLLDPSAAIAHLLGSSRHQPQLSSLDLAQLKQRDRDTDPLNAVRAGTSLQQQSHQQLLLQKHQEQLLGKTSGEALGLQSAGVKGDSQGSLGALQGLDMLSMPLEQQLLLEQQVLLQMLQKQKALITGQPPHARGPSGLNALDAPGSLQDLAARKGSALDSLPLQAKLRAGPGSQAGEKLSDQGGLMEVLLQAQAGWSRVTPPPALGSMDSLSLLLQASQGQGQHEYPGLLAPAGSAEGVLGLADQLLLRQKMQQRSSVDPSSMQQGARPAKEELAGSELAASLAGTGDSSVQVLLNLLQGKPAAAHAPLSSAALNGLLKGLPGQGGWGLGGNSEADEGIGALLAGGNLGAIEPVDVLAGSLDPVLGLSGVLSQAQLPRQQQQQRGAGYSLSALQLLDAAGAASLLNGEDADAASRAVAAPLSLFRNSPGQQ